MRVLIVILNLLIAFLFWLLGVACEIYYTETKYNQKDYSNSVELKATFKNYEIIDKYHNDADYFIVLLNSYTREKTVIPIKDYEYYNIYFVGDIIE